MLAILAEVSDKIPSGLTIAIVGLVGTAITFALARLTRWIAYALTLLLAAFFVFVLFALFREGGDLNRAILAEQGAGYFVLTALSCALPLIAAVTVAWGHARQSRKLMRGPEVRE